MRFVSWNVNGLRAIVKKGFEEVFATFDADVFAIQETKLQEGQLDLAFPGYFDYWSYAQKKGYSGTAVFSKSEALRVLHGLGDDYLDTEGRICALELEKLWFVDVYTPNSQDGLARIDHRMQWDDAFRDFCQGLREGVLPGGASTASKPVVICGDLNVAHGERDLKNPDRNRGNSGFSDEERGKLTELLDAGFVDTWRYLNPDTTGVYSWWSYRFNARKNNAGWRIDYFLVSDDLCSNIEGAAIWGEVMGSDHCPVSLDLAL